MEIPYFVVFSYTVKLKELNYIQPQFGKIKRESSFRQLCLFSIIDLHEEEETTPLSKKQKPEESISTCSSENESDDNEFVESKKEARILKSQAIRGMKITV